MQGIKPIAVLLLCTTLAIGVTSLGSVGEQRSAPIKQYAAQIRSIKIDQCRLQPGTCAGSIVVAQGTGGEVRLAIKPGTWIKRGDPLVLIEELGVGNDVQVQAAQIGGEERATDIDVGTTP